MKAVEKRSDARTRIVRARPEQIFSAIGDPARLARWWGPEGFSSTIHQFRFYPGGEWRLTLHGPDGQDYPNEYRVLRIEPNRFVLIEHVSAEHHFMLGIGLLAQGENTLLDWRQTFDTIEHYEQIAGFVAAANEQVLDRLSAEACADGYQT